VCDNHSYSWHPQAWSNGGVPMRLKNRPPCFHPCINPPFSALPESDSRPRPSIAETSPNSGRVGSSIYIAGSNFGGTQGPSTVTPNGTTAKVTSITRNGKRASVRPAAMLIRLACTNVSFCPEVGKSICKTIYLSVSARPSLGQGFLSARETIV